MRWNALWFDIRYAARGLPRQPAFTAAIVATLGLGMGVNATMFGIVDGLLFRPPAFLHDAERVHRLYLGHTPERDGERTSSMTSYRRYLDLAEDGTTAERMAAFSTRDMPVGAGDDTRELPVAGVSATFFGFFDVPPALGRYFTVAEDLAPAGTAVAVLGHGYWRATGADPAVVGRPITIGTRRYTVIGVAPEGFSGMAAAPPTAFVPITALASDLFRETGSAPPGTVPPTFDRSYAIEWLEVLVRRPIGSTAARVANDLSLAYRRSYDAERIDDPSLPETEAARPRAILAPVQRDRGPVRGAEARVSTWLAGVAAVVLLIACLNVGNLLLARASGRRREIAVRLAIGVGRAQLLRQLAAESFLLALIGAVAGLAVAEWGSSVLRALLLADGDGRPVFGDARLLLFTAGATVLVAVVTGLAPALYAGRTDLAATLRSGGRTGSERRSRTRQALLVLQVALSVLLLVGAGLFVRSLLAVRGLDLGYQPEHVAYVGIEMRGVTLLGEPRAELRRQLVERAQTVPGVESAARTIAVPFRVSMDQPVFVPRRDATRPLGPFAFHAVSPGYFATMGTRIVRGRGIAATDAREAPRVIVVSQSMARALWPQRDALGQCVRVGADSAPCSEVVGVAQDVRSGSLTTEPPPQYYVSIEQLGLTGGGLFVRTRGPARASVESLRRALQQAMPGASYVRVTPLEEILAPVMRPWTLGATMFSVFGALALLIAALGLYAVMAYDVAQRRQELAVRSALGARAADAVRLVLAEGLRVVLAGVAIGTGLALLAGRWLAPLLFDTSAQDPVVLGGVVATLVAVAVLAGALPAWRAARVAPSLALRSD